MNMENGKLTVPVDSDKEETERQKCFPKYLGTVSVHPKPKNIKLKALTISTIDKIVEVKKHCDYSYKVYNCSRANCIFIWGSCLFLKCLNVCFHSKWCSTNASFGG